MKHFYKKILGILTIFCAICFCSGCTAQKEMITNDEYAIMSSCFSLISSHIAHYNFKTQPVGTHQDIKVYTNLIPQKFHIYFDPNGGTMESTSMEVEYDKYYYSFPTPKREHYQFLGWVDENNNEVTKMQYNKTEDTYLTATWQSLE